MRVDQEDDNARWGRAGGLGLLTVQLAERVFQGSAPDEQAYPGDRVRGANGPAGSRRMAQQGTVVCGDGKTGARVCLRTIRRTQPVPVNR
jgi:hypothetical protein